MFVYVLLFSFIIIMCKLQNYSYVFINRIKPIKGDKLYIYSVAGILILFMGLRATNVGCDVIQYFNRYKNANVMYNLGITYSEWGFNYISYFFHDYLKLDFQFFLLFIAIVCIVSLSVCIYKYSDDILLSFILYLTIGNFALNMSGLRQTIAISLSLFAIVMAEKRKPILFYLLIFVASIIHNSALIFMPVYFLWGKTINRKYAFILLIIAVSAFFYRQLLNPIITYLSPERYSKYSLIEGYSINCLVILVPIIFCIYSLLFLNTDEDGKFDKKNSFFYCFSCISIFMMILSLNNGQLGRLAYYFSIGNLITVSAAMKSHKQYDRKIATIIEIIMIVLCLLYFFISTPGGTLRIDRYMFFWQ